MKYLLRWIFAAAALALLFTQGHWPAWNIVLSTLLASGVLTLGLAWSDADWRQALVAVFVFEFIVGGVNALDEAVLFHVMQGKQAAGAFAGLTLVSVLLALILALVPPIRGQFQKHSDLPGSLWARVSILAVAYIALYFIAGTIVWPYVKSFYQGRTLPQPGPLMAVQFVRGLIFVAAARPWLKIIRGRTRAMLFFGAAYSILGGVAPLLMPNPLMPSNIRLAHGFEVGISNFVFGVLVGWILTAKPKTLTVSAASPATAA